MATKRDPHRILRNAHPINWARSFIVGAFAAFAMISVMDIFSMMGVTRFTFESYIATLAGGLYTPRSWIFGFIINLALGGLFGMLYGYFFEYVFREATPMRGVMVGFAHALIAAVALFPFFQIIREQMAMGREELLGEAAQYMEFGFFGFGFGPETGILLLMAHLLFGLTMGTLYGPVRGDRIQMAAFEPGAFGQPGEEGVITPDEDPRDRIAPPRDRMAG